ncbi:hypothetical protein GCM10011594_31680 [Nakamurella endophytica]|uniref:Uncharacterized protein n=1 Tax=Nakamurella endophytica TaxID=1748367 RepID=A0A917T4G5_9ACTN|nr:hypothetical protein GCM10011594_31680 [Nakamurella endophytica]
MVTGTPTGTQTGAPARDPAGAATDTPTGALLGPSTDAGRTHRQACLCVGRHDCGSTPAGIAAGIPAGTPTGIPAGTPHAQQLHPCGRRMTGTSP